MACTFPGLHWPSVRPSSSPPSAESSERNGSATPPSMTRASVVDPAAVGCATKRGTGLALIVLARHGNGSKTDWSSQPSSSATGFFTRVIRFWPRSRWSHFAPCRASRMYSTIFRIEKLIASTRKSASGRWHVGTLRLRNPSASLSCSAQLPRS